GAVEAAEEVEEPPLEALERIRLEAVQREWPVAVLYRGGRTYLVQGTAAELDTVFIERFGLDGVRYTPRAEEALAAVDAGEAEAAFLLRPPTVEQVRAVAERGETMPQKSTYFYPKLPSGLLFLPLD